MTSEDFFFVPEKMASEPIWLEHRWPLKTDAAWLEMCGRLLSEPATNYSFWDWSEINVLQEYVDRSVQVEEYYTDHTFFNQNVKNVKAAITYAQEVLYSEWVVPPRNNTMGLKEAIRAGKASKVYGTFVTNTQQSFFEREGVQGLKTVQKAHMELEIAMQIDENPQSITKAEWEGLNSVFPGPFLLEALNRCKDEVNMVEDENTNDNPGNLIVANYIAGLYVMK
jgi:hypothetical protein